MRARVSVLLPYRDVADTLDEAVESVLAQRGVELELVAVDDGSRDDGPARLARIAARDRRVVPLATGGVGIVGALNAALRAASGDVVARMDGDDVCHPDRLAAQLDALARAPRVAVVGTQVEGFPDDAVAEGLRRYIAWQNAIVTADDHARELFVESPLCHPSVAIRRGVLESLGGWRDVPWAEDYDLWLRVDAAGHALAKVPAVLLRWRHRAGRATFAHARYSLERFRDARAEFLAPRLRAAGRPVVVWGAGPTGKRLARALERRDVSASRFVDIDPRKVGSVARGVPVVPPSALRRGEDTVVVAVGARGARDLIRAHLRDGGFVEGEDYVCAS